MLFGGNYNPGPVKGTGTYNLLFVWDSGNRFVTGSSASYTLDFSGDLKSSPFVANELLSNNGGIYSLSSVAHVQGIGDGTCSGWIVSGSGTIPSYDVTPCGSTPPNVPEPGVLGLFAFGLLLTGIAVGRRRQSV